MKKMLSIFMSLLLIGIMLVGCKSRIDNPSTVEYHTLYDTSLEELRILPSRSQQQYNRSELYTSTDEGYFEWNTAKYDSIDENDFLSATTNPLSTFSINVDTASYANLRRMIRNGISQIPSGAVRVEEVINYFKYDYPQPNSNEKFSITTELSENPWNMDTKLLRIGIQAKDIDYSAIPPSNLVFLLDVSGSMAPLDRLPMVQAAMKLLVENLNENDIVSIVVYAAQEGIILDGVRGSNTALIMSAIDDLMAGGGTNGGRGLQTAYDLALKHYINGGSNRIIWCTDGDLNIGVTDNSSIGKMASDYAKKGVYLSIFGVGNDNFNDSLLKEASKKGKGNYHYLDNLLEARKALVEEMGGTLIAVAKDVKIQVDFNPEHVKGYRLIGYENSLMNAEDFNDDSKSAGVLGAGHRVTALYEVALIDSKIEIASAESRYKEEINRLPSNELLTVAVRYKEPNMVVSHLVERSVRLEELKSSSEDQKFTQAVAMWTMLLSDSKHRGSSSLDEIIKLLDDINLDDRQKDFYMLVKESEYLIKHN